MFKKDAIVNTVIIAVVSAGVAALCFGVLESSADGSTGPYQVGGAIAGFLATASLLWRVFRSLDRDVNQQVIESLMRENRALQDKVMRSAPYPEGFVPEISERDKLVLARPRSWEQRGGYIFSFEHDVESGDDPFPLQFSTKYHILDEHESANEYVEARADLLMKRSHSFTQETIAIGGESNVLPARKIITTSWMRVESREDWSGARKRVLSRVYPGDFVGEVTSHQTKILKPPSREYKLLVTGWGFVPENMEAFVEDGQDDLEVVVESKNRLFVTIPADLTGPQQLGLRRSDLVGETLMTVNVITNDRETTGSQAIEIKDRSAPTPGPAEDGRSTDPHAGPIVRIHDVQFVQTQRILVLCHKEDRVLLFEFEDNVEDVTTTTDEFNAILNSVRFL